MAPDIESAASPQEAFEGISDLLARGSSDITMPEGPLVATGFTSSSNATFGVTVDGRAAATVDMVDLGSGWLVTAVKI